MNENYPNTTNGNGNGASNNQEEQGTDIRVYLFKLLHFWPWLLLGLSVGLAGAFLMNRYATPRYQVQADIVLKDPYKDKSQDPVNFTGMFLKTYDMEAYESEVAVLNSAPILQRALEQLPAFGAEFTGIGRIATALAYPNPPGLKFASAPPGARSEPSICLLAWLRKASKLVTSSARGCSFATSSGRILALVLPPALGNVSRGAGRRVSAAFAASLSARSNISRSAWFEWKRSRKRWLVFWSRIS